MLHLHLLSDRLLDHVPSVLYMVWVVLQEDLLSFLSFFLPNPPINHLAYHVAAFYTDQLIPPFHIAISHSHLPSPPTPSW